MNHTVAMIQGFVAVSVWMAGLVLASGFWSTFFAFIFPPWGWYLVVSNLFLYWGVIS